MILRPVLTDLPAKIKTQVEQYRERTNAPWILKDVAWVQQLLTLKDLETAKLRPLKLAELLNAPATREKYVLVDMDTSIITGDAIVAAAYLEKRTWLAVFMCVPSAEVRIYKNPVGELVDHKDVILRCIFNLERTVFHRCPGCSGLS